MIALIFPVILLALFLWLRKRSRSIDLDTVAMVELPSAGAGVLDVPVRGLESRGGFGAMTKNSLSPKLQIVPGGFRFKIFRENELPFAQISKIDLQKGFFGSAILSLHGGGRTLWVTLPNMGIARAVLVALPTTIAVTPTAARLRDWTPRKDRC
jgi:hypothetical protein